MLEEARLKRQSAKNTLLFFVVFALIFSLLGVFVYQTVASNIFRAVDEQILIDSDLSVADMASVTYDSMSAADVDATVVGSAFAITTVPDAQVIEESIEVNPQNIVLTRNDDGTLVDEHGIYATYPASIANMPYDDSVYGVPYPIDHDGHHYRAANYRIDNPGAGQATTLQFVANVDSEIAILDQFTVALVGALVAALVVSAAASYALSRKTLKPIAAAWAKQTEFVQNASHELRTPLTVIRTTQELLLEHPQARIVDRFEDITLTIEETARLTRLAEDLLLLTASDAQVNEIEKTETDLSELASSLAAPYADLAGTQEKTLTVDAPAHLVASVDPDKVKQLIAILLDNAIKYTECGDLITVAVEESARSVQIRVADTGVGISDEDLPHVFERFYRADKARSRETGGNGLGLAIAQSIAGAHGGTIEMTHNEPRGTAVTVVLPR